MAKPLGPMALSDEPVAPIEVEWNDGTTTVRVPTEVIAGLLRPFNGRARTVLISLLRGHSQGMAAAAAGVDTDTVTRWTKREPQFGEAVKLASDLGFRSVYEAELYDRALDRGDRASGRLLEVLLKSRSADYRDKAQVSMEVTHRAVSAGQAMIEGYTPAADSNAT